MALKIPRLGKNRHGTFYVRVYFFTHNGQRKLKQFSLNTKVPEEARLLALQFNLKIERQKMSPWDRNHNVDPRDLADILDNFKRPTPVAPKAKIKENFESALARRQLHSDQDNQSLTHELKVILPHGEIEFDFSNRGEREFAEKFIAQIESKTNYSQPPQSATGKVLMKGEPFIDSAK